jgi:hypothetical protein
VTNFKETYYVFQIHLFLSIKYAAAGATYYILKKLSTVNDQIPPELINTEGRTLHSEIHKLIRLE